MNPFDTVSAAIFVFSSAMENLKNKIKLKSPIRVLSYNKQRWPTCKRDQWKKKVWGIFHCSAHQDIEENELADPLAKTAL